MKEFIKGLLRENFQSKEVGNKEDVKYAQGVLIHTYSNEIEELKLKCKKDKLYCSIYDNFVEAVAFNDKDKINKMIRKYFPSKLNEDLISEHLMDIDDDVDMIYEKYFKSDFDEIESTGKISHKIFKSNTTDTSILKSPLCIEAHKLNPCVIIINNGSNYYFPNKQIISLSINKNAENFIVSNGNGDLAYAIDLLSDDNQKKSLSREFKESTIKGSIHHELVHWLDDTMHNQHINKRTKKATEFGTVDLKGIPVNATKMELQSQIHNIKQLKRKHEDVWDDLSFDDMISLSPSLTIINKSLIDPYKGKWRIDIIKRMNRENLLGNNMVK